MLTIPVFKFADLTADFLILADELRMDLHIRRHEWLVLLVFATFTQIGDSFPEFVKLSC